MKSLKLYKYHFNNYYLLTDIEKYLGVGSLVNSLTIILYPNGQNCEKSQIFQNITYLLNIEKYLGVGSLVNSLTYP